jgi:hypothetical protein
MADLKDGDFLEIRKYFGGTSTGTRAPYVWHVPSGRIQMKSSVRRQEPELSIRMIGMESYPDC